MFPCAALGVWLVAAPALAAAVDPLIEGAKLCTRILPQYEKQYGIPAHLLSAIASTESGRYHSDLKIRIPWPWTINAEGKGYYFDSKAEAIAAARRLMAQGVRSMDVGCMQVNLRHHAQAFSSLDQAFEPQHNVHYAASFLRSLYDESRSWKEAAAGYHSKTPSRGSQYVGRVYQSWEQLVDKLRVAELKVPESSLSAMRDMRKAKAASGLVYASAMPKTVTAKVPAARIMPLPRASAPSVPVQTVASYQPPRMRTVELSRQNAYRENGVLVIKPDTRAQAAEQASVAPIPSESKPGGPNFIFNN